MANGGVYTHESLLRSVPGVLRKWGLDALAIEPVENGTLNFNFAVSTIIGRFFLRCYRPKFETERIAAEHDLVRWVVERGIPAPSPIPAANASSIVEHGGCRWALFPWIAARTVKRGTLTRAQARSLGAVHGRLQATLAEHPASTGAPFRQSWDQAESLLMLDRLAGLSRARGLETWITDGIERQHRLLAEAAVLPPEHFLSLPRQLLHGDFHDEQVLFAGDEVAAVVDWEMWHADARAWEVVRSLAFSKLMDSPLLEEYLAGYRDYVQLSEAEVQMALTLWFQSRVVGFWVWSAYLIEGNERVRVFFRDTIAELEHVTNQRWTSTVRGRIVRAACR